MTDKETTEVIPFPQKPETQPDAAHVAIVANDGKPEKWFEFICHFAADDGTYSFTIWAKDVADAERRLSSLKQTATLSGQIFATVNP